MEFWGSAGASAILILSFVVRGGQAAYIRETIKIGEAWVALYASHLLVLLGACAVLGTPVFSAEDNRDAMAGWNLVAALCCCPTVSSLEGDVCSRAPDVTKPVCGSFSYAGV